MKDFYRINSKQFSVINANIIIFQILKCNINLFSQSLKNWQTKHVIFPQWLSLSAKASLDLIET